MKYARKPKREFFRKAEDEVINFEHMWFVISKRFTKGKVIL
jgi:hypothetical protein